MISLQDYDYAQSLEDGEELDRLDIKIIENHANDIVKTRISLIRGLIQLCAVMTLCDAILSLSTSFFWILVFEALIVVILLAVCFVFLGYEPKRIWRLFVGHAVLVPMSTNADVIEYIEKEIDPLVYYVEHDHLSVFVFRDPAIATLVKLMVR